MKKLTLLAICAMAAMTAWAQEEETVTTMVITRTNGTQVEVPVADVKEITFEEKVALVLPTTPDEAKTMLAGQWKCADEHQAALLALIGMSQFKMYADEVCLEIKDNEAVIFVLLNEYFVKAMEQTCIDYGMEAEWELYKEYYESMVGTYMAMEDTEVLGVQNATPNETDPTQGTFGEVPYSNLSSKTLTIQAMNFTRMEPPVTYGELDM